MTEKAMYYYNAESNTRPLEIDSTISNTGVYIRQNIKEVKVMDESSGQEITKFQYEETFLSNEEYQDYQRLQLFASKIETKRENEIIDEYTLELINTGVI